MSDTVDKTLLDTLAESFLNTLSDEEEDKEEEWDTPRGYASGGVWSFVIYLENNKGERFINMLNELKGEFIKTLSDDRDAVYATEQDLGEEMATKFINYIQGKTQAPKKQCGECHLKPGERCDICGIFGVSS